MKQIARLKLTAVFLLILATIFLMNGCLTYTFVNTGVKQQEVYNYMALSPPLYKSLNVVLYDISHKYGVGVYVVNDIDPGETNYAGVISYPSEEGYAEAVYRYHMEQNHLQPWDDYVLLAIGDDLDFADVTAGGSLADIITEDIRQELANGVIEALDEARSTGDADSEWDMNYVTDDEHYEIACDFALRIADILEERMD